MTAFISTQLDFILFFYGLAFILLGATCTAIARTGGRTEYWNVLALFGFVHGGSEWLDLSAMVVGDSPEFAIARTAVMTGSFVVLLEFARLEALRFGVKAPGRWLYVPLLTLVALAGVGEGVNAANSVARYVIGTPGALATSAVFLRFSRAFSGPTRRLAMCATAGFAAYAIAAGIIVPVAPFWPADVINHDWFSRLTGLPIQLIRGLLACWISFVIWSIWGQQLVTQVSSSRYTQFLRRQFVWTMVAMVTILVSGWALTEFLGGIYQRNVQHAARGDIDLLVSRFAGETATVEGMVKSLAGSASLPPLLSGERAADGSRAKSVLNLDVDASGAEAGYIVDKSGAVVASANRSPNELAGTPDFSAAPYFRKSIAGEAGYHFAFDPENGERVYYASYPVRAAGGKVIGVAILKKSLDALEADLSQFEHSYFFLDPDGVVVMTNRPHMMLRSLWPLPAGAKEDIVRQFGVMDNRPALKQELTDGSWINLGGERDYARRRFANHSQWSLVILNPIREIYASRVLGIVITLLVAVMTLIYLFGRERWFHDSMQMENRLELQELARNLSFQATTDSLTGLFNRLKFDEALANEMLRAARYKSPLALILYDIDQFKSVNDTHGHQAGDAVLIELSQFVANNIRSVDMLARWGGEEFVLMLPGCDAEMAYMAAEKLRAAIARIGIAKVGAVTCSFGVAEYINGDSASTLVARADRALYRAKMAGRNRVEIAAEHSDNSLASVA